MTALTTDAVVKYGTYQFSVMALTTSFQAKPIEDAAGRTVTHVVYTVGMRDYIQGDSKTDAQMDVIRQQLLAPSKTFTFTGMGFGDFTVGPREAKRDVLWGPKPRLLSCRHLGSGNCWVIDWQVEFALGLCNLGEVQFYRLMEFNYTLSIQIDKHGLTRRVYSGFLRIPNSRDSDTKRKLLDNADAYLEKIYPPLVPGFRRIPGNRTLDESKSKLTFEVTDEELPSEYAPPPGVVDASLTHSLESEGGKMLKWHGTIRGDYSPIKGGNKAACLDFFLAAVNDRLNVTRGKAESALQVVPTKFSLEEGNLYAEPKVSFTFGYTYTARAGDYMAATGMWRPVPNSDWSKWAQSLKGTAFHPRGLAQYKFDNNDDFIIDLCANEKSDILLPKGNVVDPVAAFGPIQKVFPPPPPNKSWLHYENALHIEPVDETVVLKLLPLAAQVVLKASIDTLKQNAGYGLPYAGATGGHAVQVRAAPTVWVTMQGRAARVGYPITPPRLDTVGGVAVQPVSAAGGGFKPKIRGNFGGIPVHSADWQLKYVCLQTPTGQIVAPENPVIAHGTIASNGGAQATYP